MKKIVYICSVLFFGMSAHAQQNVGIGTHKPDNSAVLDISSEDKGLLVPRLSLEQRDRILEPAKGLLIYQTDDKSGFYFYDGNTWEPLVSGSEAKSVASDPYDWTITGNSGLSSANFIGTTDAVDLIFKTNNTERGKFSSSGVFTANSDVLVNGINLGKGGGNKSNNTRLGVDALKLNTNGSHNAAFGYKALQVNTTGIYNMAIGSQSLYSNTTGSHNVGIGLNAAVYTTTGSENIGIGSFAFIYNTTGSSNVAIGSNSLYKSTSGNENVAIGHYALFGSTSASVTGNVAIGKLSGRLVAGNYNVFLGYSAGYNELGSNRLYISNSNTDYPLIKGEFDNKNLKINGGSTVSPTAGFMAIGNYDATFNMPSMTTDQYRLIVQDGIITEKIKIALKSSAFWADYVFDDAYKLMPLQEVKAFVKENNHLPNVPSAEEVLRDGIDMAKMNAKLLEKIEELTLYIIEQDERLKALENK